MRLSIALVCSLVVLGSPATARAQAVYFADDFACSDEDAFGAVPGLYGWEANYAADPWQTDENGGVSPKKDDSAGGFGAPVDDYENFLLTGHPSWNDIRIEATMRNTDDDAMGLVVRYAGPGSYYACYATKHRGADCNGGGANMGVRVALLRVDTAQTCTNDYVVAEQMPAFAYAAATTYRIRLEAIGGAVQCIIDTDLDGILGSAGDAVLAFNDPQPLPSGLAGLYSFDNGLAEPGLVQGSLVFDDVVVTGFDPDADMDGLPDAVELAIGTNPNDPDSDDDGIGDAIEALMPKNAPNTDAAGGIDALDVDSDDDGIPDLFESGGVSPPVDTDCDGIPDYKDTDSDGDGVPDAIDVCPTLADPAQADADQDGAGDACELLVGTDPADADSDDDGALDGKEPGWYVDSDKDGLVNALDPDSDDDGLFDGTELGLGCDNAATDKSKGHCKPDADGGATTTLPYDADTDDGGVSDGNEDFDLDGVIDAGETDPNDPKDDVLVDSDGDGLSDALEKTLGTNPKDADSDDDGVMDGAEPSFAVDSDQDGLINALDPDSDNDGLFDGTELGLDCTGPGTNAAAGHCKPDGDSGLTKTNPLVADTDGGGVPDGAEDADLDGVIDAGETDPNDPSDDANVIDSDGDGLSDALELKLGTNPEDADSDDDGVADGAEPNFADDTDGDGSINALDPDSDGDGLFDGTELGLDCTGPGTDVTIGNCLADADAGATKTSAVNADTDGGGVPDGVEDQNHDGDIDAGETDPNDPSDDMPCKSHADCGGPDDGTLCDPNTKQCIPGCNGEPDGGCPAGLVCTSTDATVGACVPAGAGGGGGQGGVGASSAATGGAAAATDLDRVVAQGGGCLCAAPGAGRSAHDTTLSVLVLAAVGWLARARRRSRRLPSTAGTNALETLARCSVEQ